MNSLKRDIHHRENQGQQSEMGNNAMNHLLLDDLDNEEAK